MVLQDRVETKYTLPSDARAWGSVDVIFNCIILSRAVRRASLVTSAISGCVSMADSAKN